MYRPEGWKNPHNVHDVVQYMPQPKTARIEREAFEAGADAMLEGLKKEGQPTDRCNGRVSKALLKKKGYLVFIPEEK